jgi:hypothetical protein
MSSPPSSPTNNTPSSNNISNTIIVKLTTDETQTTSNTIVHNQQGTTLDGSEVTHTTMDTTDPLAPSQIKEDLVNIVSSTYYDDEKNPNISSVLDEIKLYAGRIKCDDFHGKGTIDDYTELFQAAAKIANESKQMQLDVNIEGFSEFGKAADDLSALFNSFIVKLQNVSIIDDTAFLMAVADSLKKIWNLSEVFGRFKETIMATTTVQLPKSAYDTSLLLAEVMNEVNCAMNYIGHFVNPGPELLPKANLSTSDKNIITTAVATIDNWNVLCDQGVNIAMANNTNVQTIKNVNNSLKAQSNALASATNSLKLKLALFNIAP